MKPGDIDELGSTVVTTVAEHGLDDAGSPGHLQMVVFGNGTFATHALPDGGEITIGRSSGCTVTVDEESISRRHAIVTISANVMIEDLGSANGTTVRGQRLQLGKPVQISVGELVMLGKASMFLQRRALPARPRALWTHDYFEARLGEECAREQRTGTAFALLHIHPDRRSPASFVEETLGQLVRESDILGKYGPQHYEVLLPDTPPDKAQEAIRRIDRKLRDRGLTWEILVACCPRDGRSPYQLSAHVRQPEAPKEPAAGASDVVVSDPQMQSLHRMVEQIAASQIGVLLLGETGVGKEVFARAVHSASPRHAKPFVELNCAALTESLLESELFGHEKGAFTNATATKPGLIEAADGGTLFLDEIGDMPMATQAKLLRVIEDSQLRRVGALKSRAVDVRVVAATNADLEAKIAAGTFRRDLYFRLNGVTLLIPPLRERPAELEPLAKAFIRHAAHRDNKTPPTLTPEALEMMRGYSWPGNVRELKNVMERAVLLSSGGAIRPEQLPLERMRATFIMTPPTHRPAATEAPPNGPPRKGSAEEEQWILEALERAGGNQTAAARLLGISRRTLVNRLNDYNVQRPRKNRKPTEPPED